MVAVYIIQSFSEYSGGVTKELARSPIIHVMDDFRQVKYFMRYNCKSKKCRCPGVGIAKIKTHQLFHTENSVSGHILKQGLGFIAYKNRLAVVGENFLAFGQYLKISSTPLLRLL